MKIGDKHYRSIWVGDDGHSVHIFDQTQFPHSLEIMTLKTMTDAAVAIREMKVRGAPLIGAVGAFGLALALREEPSDRTLSSSFETLLDTRPTAVNPFEQLRFVIVTPNTPGWWHRIPGDLFVKEFSRSHGRIRCNIART